MTDRPTPEDLASLQTAHPDQVVFSQLPGTFYVGFDLHEPSFDNERVRQALNYAIDRDHVVELLGGPASYHPTCQVLPPNFQGYEPFCPYTLGSTPSGGSCSAASGSTNRRLLQVAQAAEVILHHLVGLGVYLPHGEVACLGCGG